MVRRLLWASLGLTPLTVLVHYAFHVGGTTEFILAAAALVPLAWLIGDATKLRGALPISAYAGAATAYFLAGDRDA